MTYDLLLCVDYCKGAKFKLGAAIFLALPPHFSMQNQWLFCLQGKARLVCHHRMCTRLERNSATLRKASVNNHVQETKVLLAPFFQNELHGRLGTWKLSANSRTWIRLLYLLLCASLVYSSNFADLDILCSGSSPRRSLESRDPIAVANKAWLLQAGTMDHRRLS